MLSPLVWVKQYWPVKFFMCFGIVNFYVDRFASEVASLILTMINGNKLIIPNFNF